MKKHQNSRELSAEQTAELIETLKERFEKNKLRHPGVNWHNVASKIHKTQEKLWSLYEMERTGGEPDIVRYDSNSDEFIFFDCSTESPSGRRSLCYDREALDKRKEFKPVDTAIDLSLKMGIEILSEDDYIYLQKLGNFDNKTSSWLKTPDNVRKLGGAIFGDMRYGRVFFYHNGAESYYASRGFRGLLRI
jgi:hypothetical protein